MRIEDLLSQRNETNVVHDFSALSRDELAVFVNSRINGEDSLSDVEMEILETGLAKIKTRPGKPDHIGAGIEWRPGETPEQYVRRYAANQQ